MDQTAMDGVAPSRGMVIDDRIRRNAVDLERELEWFARVLSLRFSLYFGQQSPEQDILEIAPPDLSKSISEYAAFLHRHQPNYAERLALVLGLTPHVRPRLLDVFLVRNQTFDRKFTEFGGLTSPSGGFVPTGETLAFILGGNALQTRFSVPLLFGSQHFFARYNVLRLAPAALNDSPLQGALCLSEEYLSLFTTGQARRPDFGPGFPAQFIETQLTWDDLVLHPGTRRQIEEIEIWIKHGPTLMNDWGMAPKLRPGYRCLFYGPPGTGKTMTACLLGKSTGRDVYKIDLSLVVSKYIGETEKNLARVFDQAQHKGAILFFDEADALFGKRTESKDAHDRYANLEVSFLLQRVETFDGIAILASNLKENLDDAFTRRFESIIYFPLPRPEERYRLWRQGFSPIAQMEESLDLEKVAREHVLSGGSIMNVIRYASLEALKSGGRTITLEAVLQGVRREYAKEGKAV